MQALFGQLLLGLIDGSFYTTLSLGASRYPGRTYMKCPAMQAGLRTEAPPPYPVASLGGSTMVRLVAVLVATVFALIATPSLAVQGPDSFEEHDQLILDRMVRIEIRGNRCSGIIYAGAIVLTAAHCFEGQRDSISTPVSAINVRLHADNYADVHRVRKVLRHWQFTSSNKWGRGIDDPYDIAIVFLQESEELSLPPIDLLRGDEIFLSRAVPGDLLATDGYPLEQVVYGYGTGHGQSAVGKLKMIGWIMKHGHFKWPNDVTPRLELNTEEKGVCPGDSGGPVLLGLAGSLSQRDGWYAPMGGGPALTYAAYAADYPMLLGIFVSSGAKPGEEDKRCQQTGFYVRMDFHRHWLIEKIEEDRTIRELQNALNLAGCKAGTADGIWGKGSTAALERFATAVGEPNLKRPAKPVLDLVVAASAGTCR